MNTLLACPELFDTEGGISRILRLYVSALGTLAGREGGTLAVAALNDRAVPPDRLAPYATPALVRTAACARGRARLALEVLRLPRGGDARIVCGHIGQLPLACLLRPRTPVQSVACGNGLAGRTTARISGRTGGGL